MRFNRGTLATSDPGISPQDCLINLRKKGMMEDLVFRSTDLMIKDVFDSKQGVEVEVLQIRGGMAFNPQVIEWAKSKGVQKYVERTEEGEKKPEHVEEVE